VQAARVSRRALARLPAALMQTTPPITGPTGWPPGRDAVGADDAEQAVRDFAARRDRRPTDVAVPLAWSTADRIEPWPDGASFFPRIAADIRAATSSVHVLMFGWREGEVGTMLADLLIGKVAEGVAVRVVVDSMGSRPFGAAAPMYERLRQAGVQVVVNRALPWHRPRGRPGLDDVDWRRRALGRFDHRKLYVIDGTAAWIGGAGIEDHFADGRFHDVMARVTGDVVRQAQAVFLLAFHAHGGAPVRDLGACFPPQPVPGTIPVVLLQVVPGGFKSATIAIRQLIDEAQSRVDIVNPYLTDADMIGRILAAAERGVRVRIVVSERSNNGPASAVLRGRYRSLLEAGAAVYELPGVVVHAKVVVADDTVVFGTVNLDAWALYRNYEVAIMARSAETATLFEQWLVEPDIAASKSGVAPTALRGRAVSFFWTKLARIL
jgi:cardiolipin synthase